MEVLTADNTSMTSLLDSFKTVEPVVKNKQKPNIKMSINTAESRNTENNKKRVVKTVKCHGRLANKGGKLVPEVVCSTDKIQLPTAQKQENRDHLLKQILGEVKKSKEDENEVMPFEQHEHPLGHIKLPKKTKKPCGCKKKLNIEQTPPVELFPEMAPVNVNSNNNGNGNIYTNNLEQSTNNDNALTNDNSLPKKSKKRRTKSTRNSQKGKPKFKTVQLSLKGKKPKIPTVNVVRKKKKNKGSKKKKKGQN
jgi:hypothetical protein